MTVKSLVLDASSRDRFWAKVVKTDTCWLWTGRISETGYGYFRLTGRTVRAHRVAFASAVGELIDGLTIDHLCRVRRCVRPDHLQQVTQRTNILLGEGEAAKHAQKTHCKYGHAFDEANTHTLANGWRWCRACDARRKREAYVPSRKALAITLQA